MSTGDKVRERLRQLSEALKAAKEQNRQLQIDLLTLQQQALQQKPDQTRLLLETASQNQEADRKELEALRADHWQNQLQWERDLRHNAETALQREIDARREAELALQSSRAEIAQLQARTRQELSDLETEWTRRYAALEVRSSQEPTWPDSVLAQRIQALSELESWFESSALRLESTARGARGLAIRVARAERLESHPDVDIGQSEGESHPTAVEGTLSSVQTGGNDYDLMPEPQGGSLETPREPDEKQDGALS